MTQTPPLVSVGLPVHDEASFLPAALDSLLAQDYPELEIVISDNASTDGTREICRAYARDARISYHREETNTGAAHNFNRVFQLSRGQYFMWASGHDTRDPSSIRKCVEVMEQRPDVVVCYPRTLFTEYGESTAELMDDDTLETVGLPTSERLRTTIYQAVWCNVIYGVIRSSALRRTRLVRKCFGADHILLAELSVQGAFHQLAEPLFFRQANRPSECEDERIARTLAMVGSQNGRSHRRPHWAMGWEHLLGVWHVSNTLPAKLTLTIRTAYWFWGRWHNHLLEERTLVRRAR